MQVWMPAETGETSGEHPLEDLKEKQYLSRQNESFQLFKHTNYNYYPYK